MVGNSGFGPVNRHGFVRATTSSVSASHFKPKTIRFPPSPGDHLAAPTTKSAHLLRLTRYPPPYPRFPENRRRSTCGFVFARFGMIGDGQSNIVDGPVLCRTPSNFAQKRRHGEGRCLRGGWGWGWGLRFGFLPATRGPLAPGAVVVPSAYGYPRPGLRRRPWR